MRGILLFFCFFVFGKFGSKYIPPWGVTLDPTYYNDFERIYGCPAFTKAVYSGNQGCFAYCEFGTPDFDIVNKVGLGVCSMCHSRCSGCSFSRYNGFCSRCATNNVIYYNLKNPVHDAPRRLTHYCGPDTPCNTTNGFYRDWESASCLACNGSCKTCWGTTSNDCLSCDSNRYLTYNRTCLICDPSCLTCSNGNTCTSCDPTLNLVNGMCINNDLFHIIPIEVVTEISTEQVTATVTTTIDFTLTFYNLTIHELHFETVNNTHITTQIHNSTKTIVEPDCNIITSTDVYSSTTISTEINNVSPNATTIYNQITESEEINLFNSTVTLSEQISCAPSLTQTTAPIIPLTCKIETANIQKIQTCDDITIVTIITSYLSEKECLTTETSIISSYQYDCTDSSWKTLTQKISATLTTSEITTNLTLDAQTTAKSSTSSFSNINQHNNSQTSTTDVQLAYSSSITRSINNSIPDATMFTTIYITPNASPTFQMSSIIAFATNPMFILIAILICTIFVMFSCILNMQKKKINLLIEQMQNVEMNVTITDQVLPSRLLH